MGVLQTSSSKRMGGHMVGLLVLCFVARHTISANRLIESVTEKHGGSLHVLVIGDWGRRGLYNQSQLATQMGKVGKEVGVDFIISTGDNFYENGLTGVADTDFQDSFSKIYTAKSLQKIWHSVLGNHDYRGDVLAQLNPVLRARDNRWHCRRSFNLRYSLCTTSTADNKCKSSAQFFFIDTTPFVDEYWEIPNEHKYDWRGIAHRGKYIKRQLQDLILALKDSTATWKIVVGHHPIRSVGHHGDTPELDLQLRPILEAVCYLNNYGEDFKGGLFHFQEGEPTTIVPKIGDAIFYTADEDNMHCVDEITDGERCTLTLWFTRDSSHNEDAKLINQLSDQLCVYQRQPEHSDSDSTLVHSGEEITISNSHSNSVDDKLVSEDVTGVDVSGHLLFSSDSIPGDWLPMPAPSNMYWINPENSRIEESCSDSENSALEQHSGFDIRWARISQLGFELCFEKSQSTSIEYETIKQTNDCKYALYVTDALQQPLQLKWKGVGLPKLFINSLHAIQVVLFYQWKIRKQSEHCGDRDHGHGSAMISVGEDSDSSKPLSFKMHELPNFRQGTSNMSFSMPSFEKQLQFNCEDFAQIVCDWEHYICTLWRALLISLPRWRTYAMIFPVPT